MPEPGAPSALPGGTTDAASHGLLIFSGIRFLREGLAEVLARDGAFHVAGTVGHIDDALTIARGTSRLVVLIDAALPNGLAEARQLRDVSPEAHMIVLALMETEANVIAWAEAGATGYVPRNVALSDLVLFIQEILRGEQACSTQVAASLMRWVSRVSRTVAASSDETNAPPLTARETQVVELICAGLSNKEISRRLNVGLATIKSHVHNLLTKLELRRRGQLARWSRDQASKLGGGGPSGGDSRSSSPSSRGRTMDSAAT